MTDAEIAARIRLLEAELRIRRDREQLIAWMAGTALAIIIIRRTRS